MRFSIIPGIAASAVLAVISSSASALSVGASGSPHGVDFQVTPTLLPRFTTSFDIFQGTDRDAHDDRDRAYTAAIMFHPIVPIVDLSVGARYQYQTTGYGDGGGVSIGGSAFVPTALPMTSVGVYGFYTPDLITQGDVRTSKEYGVLARVNPAPKVSLTGGYRVFSTEFDREGSHRLDHGPFIGASFGF